MRQCALLQFGESDSRHALQHAGNSDSGRLKCTHENRPTTTTTGALGIEVCIPKRGTHNILPTFLFNYLPTYMKKRLILTNSKGFAHKHTHTHTHARLCEELLNFT